MAVIDHVRNGLDELDALRLSLAASDLDGIVDQLEQAERVFVSGQGRSGLVGGALAVRLGHLGMAVHAVSDVTVPAITAGDLLVASSSSGSTPSTLQHARTAVAVGARVTAITSSPKAELAALADLVVVLPIRGENGVPTRQHAGSLFEQGCLVLFDAVASELQDRSAIPAEEMDRRHTNLQ